MHSNSKTTRIPAKRAKPKDGWKVRVRVIGDGREHGDDPVRDTLETEQLYRLLEEEVIPAFCDRDPNGILDA